jgi:hypothetical protein
VLLGYVLTAVAGVLLAAMFWCFNSSPPHGDAGIAFGLAFVGFSATVFIPWVWLSVRCPRCRGRPSWHLVRTRNWNDNLQVEFLDACPICGDRSEEPSPAEQRSSSPEGLKVVKILHERGGHSYDAWRRGWTQWWTLARVGQDENGSVSPMDGLSRR